MNNSNRNDHNVDGDMFPETDDSKASEEQVKHVASQQFIHGLLSFIHSDDESRQNRRYERLMEAIDQEESLAILKPRRIYWRIPSAIAAGILLMLTVIFLSIPTEQSAYAMVQASIDASESAGDRRYEVLITHKPGNEQFQDLHAIIDIRDNNHVVIRADTPDGGQLVVGHNDEGRWAIRQDGMIERFRPDRAWPKWINLGDSTVLVESVDDLLRRLDGYYRLTQGEPEQLDDNQELLYERVTAELIKREGPDPERIELWIDPATHIVQRMELRWPSQQRNRDNSIRQYDSLPQGELDPNGPPRPGERRDPNGRPPHMGRPGQDRPPPRREQHDPNKPPRPGEHHNLDGPPPPHHGRQGPDRPPPRFIDGPPRFGEGRHPPPPDVIVFNRVEAPGFPQDWFDPERHVK